MISINLYSPHEMQKKIAEQLRAKRLEQNLSQKTLAERSGVSYGTLKLFELSGKISLESLLKLALVLGCLDDFMALFAPKGFEEAVTLDELMHEVRRKRGRK